MYLKVFFVTVVILTRPGFINKQRKWLKIKSVVFKSITAMEIKPAEK